MHLLKELFVVIVGNFTPVVFVQPFIDHIKEVAEFDGNQRS